MLHEKVPDSLKARLPEISDELRELLKKIPSHDYVLDLDAVRAALVEPQPSTKSSPKKLAKSVRFARDPLLPRRSPGGSYRNSELECQLDSCSCRTCQGLVGSQEARRVAASRLLLSNPRESKIGPGSCPETISCCVVANQATGLSIVR
jgi:hypothetical protein